jgi:TonB family protein
MIDIHDWFASLSAWWWPRLADHLWQATLFGIVVLLASLMLKRAPARSRHSLWLLATAKFIIPAALLVFLTQSLGLDSVWIWLTNPDHKTNTLLRGITDPATALVNSYDLTVVATDGVHNELYCALTIVWLAGCAVLLAAWRRGRSKCRYALLQSKSVTSGREWVAFARAKDLLGVRRPVQLMLSPLPVAPGVFNLWKPIILLPESIAEHLDDDELLAIMLHELVHVQRRDNLVGRLHLTLAGLFWFHPLVWLISRKLFDEREQACDEKVLETYSTPETYAAGILKVVRFSFGWRVAGVTGAGSGSNLRRRIDNIMETGKEKRRAGIVAKLLTSGLLGITLVAIVFGGAHPRSSVTTDNKNRQDVVNLDPVANHSSYQQRDTQDQTSPPPPPLPPQPVNPAQPAAPANPAQPPVPPAAENSAAPRNNVAPAQPANPPQPSSPAQPPAPPATPASMQEKSEKPRDDKQELKKGGLIEAPKPIYPREAREKKVEGQVTVSIVIGEEGTVISARPTSGPELLQGAAKDAALKARFHPTLVNGKPAKVSGAMTYDFVLDEKEKDE